jgi:UDP-N-acetylglucosamine 1-carboxyvinyltransferase
MAALIAPDVSTLTGVHYLDRGYENLVGKLATLGANISRVPEKESKNSRADALPPLAVASKTVK